MNWNGVKEWAMNEMKHLIDRGVSTKHLSKNYPMQRMIRFTKGITYLTPSGEKAGSNGSDNN